MNICVFGKYRVDFQNNYTYISDKEFGEYTYSEDKEEWTKDMDGGELMRLVAKLMLENDTTTFECKVSSIEHGKSVGEIAVEKFEPQDGTGETIIIKYKEER